MESMPQYSVMSIAVFFYGTVSNKKQENQAGKWIVGKEIMIE